MMTKDPTKDQHGPCSFFVSYSLFLRQRFGREDLLVLILYRRHLGKAGRSKALGLNV